MNCNSNQSWNSYKCRCGCKNLKEHHACKNDDIWNPATCTYEKGKDLASIINHFVIICDEIIDAVLSDALNTHVTSYDKATKTVQTENISTKTVSTKSHVTNLYILLTFLLITIALLIVVNIYCYQIKHRSQ